MVYGEGGIESRDRMIGNAMSKSVPVSIRFDYATLDTLL